MKKMITHDNTALTYPAFWPVGKFWFVFPELQISHSFIDIDVILSKYGIYSNGSLTGTGTEDR